MKQRYKSKRINKNGHFDDYDNNNNDDNDDNNGDDDDNDVKLCSEK